MALDDPSNSMILGFYEATQVEGRRTPSTMHAPGDLSWEERWPSLPMKISVPPAAQISGWELG